MIAFDKIGQGEPLLLIHGLGSERGVWKPIAQKLAENYEVWTVDLPGFGASDPIDNPTPQNIADHIASILPYPVHAVGNSLGAWIALEMAKQKSAQSVVGVAPAGLWATPLGPTPYLGFRTARRMQPLLQKLIKTKVGKKMVFASLLYKPKNIPEDDLSRMLKYYAQSQSMIKTSQKMRRGKPFRLKTVDFPLSLLWGNRDRLVKEPRRIPNGIYSTTVKNASHLLMWDNPERVVQEIEQHMKKQSL